MRSVPVVTALALLIAGTLGVGSTVAVSSQSPSRSTAVASAHPSSSGHAGSSALAPAVVPPARPTAAPARSTAPRPAPQRRTLATGWRPFVRVGPVTLDYPVDVVELVGLHESSHDGAQQQQPLRGAGRIGRLESRERGTRDQGAADVVVQPLHAVRAPVTGRVIRAGTYTLYCDYRDNYVVIEPDARPGWEVKVLHFQGLAVSKGDRVRAGVTVVGAHARQLPFASQVDEHTAAPHWPHVHIEVVDPTVHDRPSKPCD